MLFLSAAPRLRIVGESRFSWRKICYAQLAVILALASIIGMSGCSIAGSHFSTIEGGRAQSVKLLHDKYGKNFVFSNESLNTDSAGTGYIATIIGEDDSPPIPANVILFPWENSEITTRVLASRTDLRDSSKPDVAHRLSY